MQEKLKAVLKVLGPVLIIAGGVSSGIIDCGKLVECISNQDVLTTPSTEATI